MSGRIHSPHLCQPLNELLDVSSSSCPFEGGSRNEAQLTVFFENNLKRPIEAADLRDRYEVYRSGQSFDIHAEIIRDLCRADIVIADLSGVDPNPNVLYELGVRLALSTRPVILTCRRPCGLGKRARLIFLRAPAPTCPRASR
jgi:hypothetical protein